VSANRNRKGGPEAAGWRLATNRFPEMRIGKHMESGNRDLPLCSCAQGFTLLTQGELPKYPVLPPPRQACCSRT
jgi:hypothetical protein